MLTYADVCACLGEASPHDKTFVKRFGGAFAEALEACLNPRDVYQVLVYAALSY
jgi:hypothetical protein